MFGFDVEGFPYHLHFMEAYMFSKHLLVCHLRLEPSSSVPAVVYGLAVDERSRAGMLVWLNSLSTED